MENVVVQYIIGFGIMLVIFVLIAWLGIRRKKAGKINKHWQDY